VGGSIYVFLLELMKGQKNLHMSFKPLDVEILMPRVCMYHYYYQVDQSSPIWPWCVTLQLKLNKKTYQNMLVWLCKMVLAQHFCIVC